MLDKYKGKVVKEVLACKTKYSSDISAVVIEFEDGEVLEVTYNCTHADHVWIEYNDEITGEYAPRDKKFIIEYREDDGIVLGEVEAADMLAAVKLAEQKYKSVVSIKEVV